MTAQAPLAEVTVTIDGVPVTVPAGTLVVEAAKRVRQQIPVYCYHPKLGPAGLCRICLVEIEGMPKLQIACNTPVTDGMVVHTQNDRVNEGRATVLELFLVNHPLDCPICDKGGECDLQDYAMAYGTSYSRVADAKTSKPKAVDLGPTIVLDEERCVVCQRCVRFDDIITRERSLVVKDRGVRDIIATATGDPYHSNYSGNVTELCPVGALTSKTYRFKSRPWDLRRVQTSCTQCAVGCQQFVDTRVGEIQRTMSVEHDDAISDGWLCDRGRYNVGFYTAPARLDQPLYKQDGEWLQISWDGAFDLWAKALRDAAAQDAGSIGAVGGGRLLNEEAYVLAHLFRAMGAQNLDWRAGRQRQATPGKHAGRLADLERANVILTLGESAAERAPIMDLRVRKAVMGNRAKLVRIAPIECAPPVPHTDVASIPHAIDELGDAKRVAIVWDGVDLQAAKELFETLPAGVEVATYIPGEQGNARGAEALGMLPRDGGRDFAGMIDDARAGRMRVLSIFGANPVLHHPDGPAVREALEKTPFVAVSELFMTQTAQFATLVLPAKGAFEKSGTTTNLEGELLPVNAADIAAPPGARSDLEMLTALAARVGVALPSASEVEAAVIERLAAAPAAFTIGDGRFAAEGRTDAPKCDEGEFRVCFQSMIFAGGGTVAHDARIESLRPLPEAAISPEDADRIGAVTGDYADLESGGVTLGDLLIEVRPDMPPGTVALIAGLPDSPANAIAAGTPARIVNLRKSAEIELESAR